MVPGGSLVKAIVMLLRLEFTLLLACWLLTFAGALRYIL
jgi:hypothetical protein